MLGPRWRKVFRDLWSFKTRSLLVVLSIAVGVATVGSVAHMHTIVSRDLARSYAEVQPANAVLYTAVPFDDELVQTVERLPGVTAAEGRRSVLVRFKTRPDREWQLMELFALPDYEAGRVSKVRPEPVFDPDPQLWTGGAWPPPRREIVLERTSMLVGYLGLAQARLGDRIIVETPDGREREVRLAGVAYDFARIPATFAGRAYGYVDGDTIEWLGGPDDYTELHITVADTTSLAAVQRAADRVRAHVERGGHDVVRVQAAEPGRLPLDSYFRAITVVLGALGVLALLLSVLLVTSTVGALVAQQTRQVGVMKAIGAQAGQVAGMYAGLVLAFGALALGPAIVLALYATDYFVGFLSYFLNFKLGAMTLPPEVIALQVVLALLVPLLAALVPVLDGARMSVREAIAGRRDEPLRARPATTRGAALRTFAARVQAIGARLLSRPLLLALRNTFRRKGRLALTLTTLTLAGAIFIAVLSVRASLFATFDEVMAASTHDVEVQLIRPYRTAQVEQIARRTPGVERVESWSSASVYRVRPDGSEGPAVTLTGLPPDTQLYAPAVVSGRWLTPGDQGALVVSADVLRDEPDLQVGDTLTLKIDDRDTEWQVVGVVRGLLGIPAMYASQPQLARLTGDVGRTRSARIVTAAHDGTGQTAVAEALQQALEDGGLRVATVQTQSEQREQSGTLFNIIVAFLLSMAVMLAIVGGLGLAGTMSLNVLERTREIGIMRAIGASDAALYRVVVGEGLVIGLLSWLLALAVALPLGALLSAAVGVAFFQVPLIYRFSVDAIWIWLALVAGIAAAASMLPARSAARLTVRDTLAYEG